MQQEITNGNELKEVINDLQKFQFEIPAQLISFDELKKGLSEIINHLITNDFSRLIAILYRLDISEEKLKQLLEKAKDTPAEDIIAEMIIERQKEKIKTRKLFSTDINVCDEEKW